MERVLICRDLGIDDACRFEARGETTAEARGEIMRHVLTHHEMDWFEIEDIHVTALARLREQAA